jgi:Recombination endonuclease VII
VKKCAKCRKNKAINLFSVCRRNRDGRLYVCKKCINKSRDKEVSRAYYRLHNERIKQYYQVNKGKIAKKQKDRRRKDPYAFLDIRLRSWYGISRKQFDALRKKQNYKCKICRKFRPLCVDHDHSTGKVRALLCSRCNQGLGFFKENTFSLKNAIRYLQCHK